MYDILPELSGLHRDLTDDEYNQLEENILADGRVTDPLIVWEDKLIEGRHRLEIAQKHDIPFDVIEKEFSDMEEAQLWVIERQLGKRNVSDLERQRLRSLHAKMAGGDTGVVAERHGVSQRTVQRDIETQNIIDSMPDDIKELVSSGRLITGRRSLKNYNTLSESQKNATHQALRDNSSLTLQQAIPKEDTDLKAEDFEFINTCPAISGQQRQALSHGEIKADHKSIQRMKNLDPEQQEIVTLMLDDPEISSVGDAVKALRAPPSPEDKGKKLEKVKAKIGDAFEKILSLIDDQKFVSEDDSGHQPAIDAVRKAEEVWRRWK